MALAPAGTVPPRGCFDVTQGPDEIHLLLFSRQTHMKDSMIPVLVCGNGGLRRHGRQSVGYEGKTTLLPTNVEGAARPSLCPDRFSSVSTIL